MNSSNLRIDVVRDAQDWELLVADWARLVRETPSATVFQSFEYQRIWWRHFGTERELLILVIREAGKVIGIAPLSLDSFRYLGAVHRELCFIGTRWEVDRPVFLFGERYDDCLEATLTFLAEHRGLWDLCRIHEQAPDVAASLGQKFRQLGCLVATPPDSICPFLELRGEYTELLASRSRLLRRNLKASRRKLEALGDLRLQRFDDWPGVQEGLDIYRDLEAHSWKAAAGVGIKRSREYERFLGELAEVFGRKNGFHVLVLTVAGSPIAGTIAMSQNEAYYSLQIVHDEAYSKYSPGTLLEGFELEECFQQGVQRYDFLGGFLSNKQRWTDASLETVQLHAYLPRPRLLLLYGLYFVLKPRVKELVRRTRLVGEWSRLSWQRVRSRAAGRKKRS